MVHWGARRWAAAVIATVLSALALGVPTDIVPNPVFGRQIPTPLWAYVAWAVTSVLAGLVLATYVSQVSPSGEERRVTIGGLLSFLAVGCPTCNKVAVIALGSSGAITWFEPVQPVLALAGIALLAYALRRRLAGERACAIPTGRQPIEEPAAQ